VFQPRSEPTAAVTLTGSVSSRCSNVKVSPTGLDAFVVVRIHVVIRSVTSLRPESGWKCFGGTYKHYIQSTKILP
jgi:hypothetical protein